MRVGILAALACAAPFLAACGPNGVTRQEIMRLCAEGGQNPAYCACVTGALDRGLNTRELGLVAKARNRTDAEDRIVAENPKFRMVERAARSQCDALD